MILSKDSNNNWTPTAGGTGTFIGTKAAFDAIKDTLPVNTVAYITDDGNGDLQPVDAITNGDMHPVTSNAVYDKFASIAAVDTVTNGDMHPVTGNAVYDRLKPKLWTSSINIGTSVWDVTIARSVDFVHVKLRCTAAGTATAGTNAIFPNAPDWCKIRFVTSIFTTSPATTVFDVQTNNSVTYWGGDLGINSEWNGTCLAFDADV